MSFASIRPEPPIGSAPIGSWASLPAAFMLPLLSFPLRSWQHECGPRDASRLTLPGVTATSHSKKRAAPRGPCSCRQLVSHQLAIRNSDACMPCLHVLSQQKHSVRCLQLRRSSQKCAHKIRTNGVLACCACWAWHAGAGSNCADHKPHAPHVVRCSKSAAPDSKLLVVHVERADASSS